MRLKNKLLGLMVGGTMIGLLAMSGIGRAQSSGPVPDTFFSPLPLEEGNSLKGEPGNVEVILGNPCNSAKGKEGCASKKSKNSVSTFNDQIRIRGIFTNFDPIMEGTTCDSEEEADDNFLNSGGSTFFIGVGNGGVGALCAPTTKTGILFSLVWTPSKKSNVAVPLNGTATWMDSNNNSGTANVKGTMTLLYTGLGDCGTWAMDLTFSNVSAASLGPDKSTVNIQMDYGSEPPDGATSFGCLVTPLDVEKNSFD